jgi:hypothetical protein
MIRWSHLALLRFSEGNRRAEANHRSARYHSLVPSQPCTRPWLAEHRCLQQNRQSPNQRGCSESQTRIRDKELQHNAAKVRIHELRYEGEKEKSSFRVQNLGHDPLSIFDVVTHLSCLLGQSSFVSNS